MPTEFRSVVFGLLAQPKEEASVPHEFFRNIAGCPGRNIIEDALDLVHAPDQSPVQPSVPLEVLDALRDMASMPERANNPHQRAQGRAHKANGGHGGGHNVLLRCM